MGFGRENAAGSSHDEPNGLRPDRGLTHAARRADAGAAADVSAGALRNRVRARRLRAGGHFEYLGLSDEEALCPLQPRLGSRAGQGDADDRAGRL